MWRFGDDFDRNVIKGIMITSTHCARTALMTSQLPGAVAIPHNSSVATAFRRWRRKEYIASKGLEKGPAIKKPL